MKPRRNEDTLRYMQKIAERRRHAGGIFGTRKSMPVEGGGNLDIETRCMQEGVPRNGGTRRY